MSGVALMKRIQRQERRANEVDDQEKVKLVTIHTEGGKRKKHVKFRKVIGVHRSIGVMQSNVKNKKENQAELQTRFWLSELRNKMTNNNS